MNRNVSQLSASGRLPLRSLLQGLGERTPLKAWQVQRVIERIDSFLHPEHAL